MTPSCSIFSSVPFFSYTLAFPLSEFMISLYSLSLSSVFLSVCLTIQFALYSYHTSHLNFLPIHLKLLRPHFSQLMMYMYRDRLLSDGKFLRDRMYSALCCVSRNHTSLTTFVGLTAGNIFIAVSRQQVGKHFLFAKNPQLARLPFWGGLCSQHESATFNTKSG